MCLYISPVRCQHVPAVRTNFPHGKRLSLKKVKIFSLQLYKTEKNILFTCFRSCNQRMLTRCWFIFCHLTTALTHYHLQPTALIMKTQSKSPQCEMKAKVSLHIMMKWTWNQWQIWMYHFSMRELLPVGDRKMLPMLQYCCLLRQPRHPIRKLTVHQPTTDGLNVF